MIKLSDLNKGDRLVLRNGAIFEASVPKAKGVNQIFVRINPEEGDNGLIIASNQLNEDFSLNDIWSKNDNGDDIVEVRLANGKSYQVDNKEENEESEEDYSTEDLLRNSTLEALKGLIKVEEIAFEGIKEEYENGKISKKEYDENEKIHKIIHKKYKEVNKGFEIKDKLNELEKKVNDLDEDEIIPDEITNDLIEVLKDIVSN